VKKIIYFTLFLFPLFLSANESKIKTCLASSFLLQKDFQKRRGKYAENIQQLAWSNSECLISFECSVTKSNDLEFEVLVSSQTAKWTINQNKEMTKIE
jgi:hypothetical protein